MNSQFVSPAKAGAQTPSAGWIPAFAGMTALLLSTFTGCKTEPPKPPLVQTVAVLMFDSEANNVNAPDIMQRLVYNALRPSAYQVANIGEVNQKLNDAGIADGGQLAVADPVKLGKDLGVQGLIYGNVESFGYINVGFYSQRKVTLELKLVDVGTGQTLWEHVGTGATRNFALDKEQAKANFAKGLADQLVDKAMKNPLDEESRLATLQALKTLPGFVFSGFAQDDQTPTKGKRETQNVIKSLIRPK